MCAGIRGTLGPRVENRIRLARWGQKPEICVERLQRVRIQRGDVNLSKNTDDHQMQIPTQRHFLMNTHPACDVWTVVSGVDRTRDLVPIKSANDGRIVPDAAPRKGAVQSACSIELQLMKGK